MEREGKMNHIKLKQGIVTIICVITMISISACSSGTSTMEGTLENYFDAIVNYDVQKYTYSMLPKGEMEIVFKNSCMTEEEYWELQRKYMESNDPVVHNDITITNKDEADENDIENMEQKLYDHLNIDVDITEAYDWVEFEYINDEGNMDYGYVSAMYKTGGIWYIYPEMR